MNNTTIKSACRTIFAYKNGDLFLQLIGYKKDASRRNHGAIYKNTCDQIQSLVPDDAITVLMPSVRVKGKFVRIKGTGILLKDWSIENTYFDAVPLTNIDNVATWLDADDGFYCSCCGHKFHFGESSFDTCLSCGSKMSFPITKPSTKKEIKHEQKQLSIELL